MGLDVSAALVAEQGARRRRSFKGSPSGGVQDGLPKGRARTVSSRMVGIDRPEHRRLICAQASRGDEGPPLGVLLWSDRRPKCDEFEALDVSDGSATTRGDEWELSLAGTNPSPTWPAAIGRPLRPQHLV